MSAVSSAAVPRTRERILDVALDLFAEEGYSGTTVTEIERRAGLSPGSGSFYRHFPSKEEVLRAAVAREVERLRAEIAAAQAAPPPARTTRRTSASPAVTRALGDIRLYDRLMLLMFTEGDRVPGLRPGDHRRAPAARARGWTGTTVPRWPGPHRVGGYHLFSLVQGRPFEDIPEAEFLEAVARVTGRSLRRSS